MKNRMGLAMVAIMALATAPIAWSRQASANGPHGTGGRIGSFKHRDTKKHFSREERNRKYKAARRANRLRRIALER